MNILSLIVTLILYSILLFILIIVTFRAGYLKARWKFYHAQATYFSHIHNYMEISGELPDIIYLLQAVEDIICINEDAFNNSKLNRFFEKTSL